MTKTTNHRDFDCAPDVQLGDEITLSSVTYLVEKVTTQADHRARGLNRVADLMIRNSCYADLQCRRRRGKKLHLLRAFRTPQGQLIFRHVLSLHDQENKDTR